MLPRPIPCRLPVVHAVYTSSLAPPLRGVALALAWFTDDTGGNAWPSLATLAGMVAADPRSVQRALRELRQLGVLEAENLSGGRGLTTRYRFDLQVLASLKPRHRRHPLQSPKGRHTCQGFAEERVTSEPVKGDTHGPKGRHFVSERVSPVSPDPYERTGSYKEQRGADAPAALEEDKLKTEEEEVVVLCSECDFRGSRFEATSHFRKTRHVLRSSEVQVRYVTHVTEGKKRSG